jgi:hypothetical protein
MKSSGKLSSGVFPNERKCLTGITHVKGKSVEVNTLGRALA